MASLDQLAASRVQCTRDWTHEITCLCSVPIPRTARQIAGRLLTSGVGGWQGCQRRWVRCVLFGGGVGHCRVVILSASCWTTCESKAVMASASGAWKREEGSRLTAPFEGH